MEAQQATEARLKALGSSPAEEAIVFEETGEVLVAAGEKASKATSMPAAQADRGARGAHQRRHPGP